jgi:hypothetical protein
LSASGKSGSRRSPRPRRRSSRRRPARADRRQARAVPITYGLT